MARLIAILLALSFWGCSLSIRGPHPGALASDEPNCDRSAPGPQVLDALGGSLSAAGAGAGVGFLSSNGRGEVTGAAVGGVVFFAAASVLYWSAFTVGARRLRACKNAEKKHTAWKRTGYVTDPAQCEILRSDLRQESDPKIKAALQQQVMRLCTRRGSDAAP